MHTRKWEESLGAVLARARAMEEQLDLWPEVPPPMRRYDGEDRRRCARGVYLGEERRIPDPCTEQDHPEHFGAN